MGNAFSSMCDIIKAYILDSKMVYIYLASLLVVAFSGKERRRQVLYPSLLMMLIIINPLCYKYIWERILTGYFWRILWMLPVIPVIACAVVQLCEWGKRLWAKLLLAFVPLLFIVVLCTNIYSYEWSFAKANNPYKLPNECFGIIDKLSQLEIMGDILVCEPLYCYARQYDVEIKLAYGRDIHGYIMADSEISEGKLLLHSILDGESQDIDGFAQLMRQEKISAVLLPETKFTKEQLTDAGFQLLYSDGTYAIWLSE